MKKIIIISLLVSNLTADFYALRLSTDNNLSVDYNISDDLVVLDYHDRYDVLLNKKYKTLESVELAQGIYSSKYNVSIVKIKDYKLSDNSEILNSIHNKPITKIQNSYKLEDFNNLLRNLKIPTSTLIKIFELTIYAIGIIILFVVLFKLRLESKTKKIEILRNEIKVDIFRAMDKLTPISFKPKVDFEYIAVIDGCVTAITQLSKEEDYSAIKPIHNYLESINAFDFIYNKIKNPFVIGKVEFIERLGLTLYEDNKFFLFCILDNNGTKRNRINEHAIAGLSYLVNRFDLQFYLSHVVKLNSSGKFLEFIFTNIMKNLIAHKHHSGISFILSYLYKSKNNTILLKSCVEAIGFIKYEQVRKELCDLYHMTLDDGVKTTIVRTFGKFTPHKDIDKILFLALIDKTPLLRITAAKSMAIANLEGQEELLIKTLSDQVYHVRLNLALSLSHSDIGRSILEFIIETSTDKYARDMANHALIMNKRFESNESILEEQITSSGKIDDYI